MTLPRRTSTRSASGSGTFGSRKSATRRNLCNSITRCTMSSRIIGSQSSGIGSLVSYLGFSKFSTSRAVYLPKGTLGLSPLPPNGAANNKSPTMRMVDSLLIEHLRIERVANSQDDIRMCPRNLQPMIAGEWCKDYAYSAAGVNHFEHRG